MSVGTTEKKSQHGFVKQSQKEFMKTDKLKKNPRRNARMNFSKNEGISEGDSEGIPKGIYDEIRCITCLNECYDEFLNEIVLKNF